MPGDVTGLHRIHSHLRRLGSALGAVIVRLSDVNGPKGGVDKRCQIMLRRTGRRPVTIDELDVDAYTAVDIAVDRAARAAGRERERARATRRRWGRSPDAAVS
jgi:ribosome-associated translation inhibitor RaiA